METGRSPRVRGSRGSAPGRGRCRGSIPACAGEPPPQRRRTRTPRVDPRVCGGARQTDARATAKAGRSPRVRGSRPLRCLWRQDLGSIPACAGEPRYDYHYANDCRVDPRVCGGASPCRVPYQLLWGRSPRVRGSLSDPLQDAAQYRSIPACAGEPASANNAPQTTKVDPRVCGGAAVCVVAGRQVRGRSPRVRGSRLTGRGWGDDHRSIPACAGEPGPLRSVPLPRRVDPRVCGGAIAARVARQKMRGRSPRVRGSQLH